MKVIPCIFLCVVGVLAAGPLVLLRAEKKTFEVRHVSFEGNKVYDPGDLLKLMVNRPRSLFHSTDFHQAVLDDDLRNLANFYHDNGYLEANVAGYDVTADSADESVDIRVRIFEGARTKIDSIGIQGNKAFADTVLLDLVGLKRGDPLLGQNIRDGMVNMITMYADSGYLSAKVNPGVTVDSLVHLASVNFRVTEGPQDTISGILVEGLVKTRESVVRRELLFKEGEVVHYSQLLETQRQLYLTGLFESVFIRPDSVADATHRVVRIQLKEKLSGEFNVGLSYGSVEKLKGKIQLQTTNLAGTGRQIGSTVTANFILQRVEGSFTEPWTFGTRWRTDANLFGELQEQPSYDLNRYGGTVTVGRSLGRRSNASLTYRYENAHLSNVTAFLLIPTDFNPRVRSLTLTYKDDDRDDPFNTLEGTYQEWDNELAGTFLSGTNTFVRSILRLKWFHSFDDETTLGSGLEAGWMKAFGMSTDVPLSERFYAGGPNALRSFAYQRIGPLDNANNPLGGTVEFIWNLAELRRTVWKFVGVVGFIDVGQVWGGARDVKIKDIRISIGPGLRVNTPLGIARLDYGLNIFKRSGEAGAQLFFAMGQAF